MVDFFGFLGFGWEVQSYFRKYEKRFLLRKYNNFFNFGARNFCFTEYKNFFQVGCFCFLGGFGLESELDSP